MRIITLLLLAATLATPAIANNPQADFIANNTANGVIGVASAYGSSDFRIDFTSGATDGQKASAQSAAAVFDWKKYPDADPLNAKLAILSDTNIPAAAKIELMKFASIFDGYTLNPVATKQAWLLIQSTAPSWLTGTVKTAVETHASDFHMPLN